MLNLLERWFKGRDLLRANACELVGINALSDHEQRLLDLAQCWDDDFCTWVELKFNNLPRTIVKISNDYCVTRSNVKSELWSLKRLSYRDLPTIVTKHVPISQIMRKESLKFDYYTGKKWLIDNYHLYLEERKCQN